MCHRLRLLLRILPCAEQGYATPFVLFILSLIVMFATSGLWISTSYLNRAEMRIDMIHAHDLAHAGISLEVSRLYQGQGPQTLTYNDDFGSCDVTVQPLPNYSSYLQIKSVSNTDNGAISKVTALYNLANNSLLNWTETP